MPRTTDKNFSVRLASLIESKLLHFNIFPSIIFRVLSAYPVPIPV